MQSLSGGQLPAEYLAVADNRCSGARKLQRIPKGNLVGRQHRSAKVLLQGLNSADSSQAVAANEDGLRALGCVGANPFIELARVDGALVGRQPGWAMVDDLEPLPLEVFGSLLT